MFVLIGNTSKCRLILYSKSDHYSRSGNAVTATVGTDAPPAASQEGDEGASSSARPPPSFRDRKEKATPTFGRVGGWGRRA